MNSAMGVCNLITAAWSTCYEMYCFLASFQFSQRQILLKILQISQNNMQVQQQWEATG